MLTNSLKRLAARTAMLIASTAVALSVMTAPAHAGLKEAMNQMFVVTSTNPQAINTQRLKGIYGGSMTLRTISSGINVIQFAPPRIDAGCGGIDIFFGSFSFINGAQFEQLIRSIAANAVGFAIKAAIKAMCSPCSTLIAELETAMRQLNAMAKNTCAIGQALIPGKDGDVMRGKLMEQASSIGSRLSTAIGNFSDAMKAENNKTASSPNETATGTGAGASGTAANQVAGNNPMDGNVVYRAAQESLSNGANSLSAFVSQNDAIRMVMGLYGVSIFNPDKTGESCSAGVPPERCVKEVQRFAPTITTWDNLLYPRKHDEEGVKVLTCAGVDCRSVVPQNLPLSSWGGVTDVINIGLFGTPTLPATAFETTPDSIVGSFVHKNGGAILNSQAQAITRIIPAPIMNLMMETQNMGEAATLLLGFQFADVLPQYLAYIMATELQGIGANVFSGQTTVDMPDNYGTNLKRKAQELDSLRPKAGDLAKMLNETTKSVITMQNLTRSPYKADQSSK